MGVVLNSHIIILKAQRILYFASNHDFIPHRYLRLLIDLNNQHQGALPNELGCFAIIVLNVKNIDRLSLFCVCLSFRQILLVIAKMSSFLQ